MPSLVTSRMYKNSVKRSPPEAGFQAINGWAAQHSGQICACESKNCRYFGPITIRYLDKAGKKMQGHYYTPDFLVLHADSVCFEEWKRESDLKLLEARSPFRYQQQEDGNWRCPPAEEAASALGLTFRVRSPAELHPTYIDNLLFLEDYFDMKLAVPVQVQTTILQRIRETPGLPLSALAYDGSGVRANDVYAMLALDLLYTDLHAAPLIQHGRVHLYLNAEQARTYAHLLPTRLTSRVGSPLPEVNAELSVGRTSAS